MKPYVFLLLSIVISVSFIGCVSTSGNSSSPSTAQQVETALLTVANVVQTINTGFLTAAPTVEQILTLTHNAGDAQVLANVANQDSTLTPALNTLAAQINTAVKASVAAGATPAQQQAAVSAAVSPSAISAIVAPIAAATPK